MRVVIVTANSEVSLPRWIGRALGPYQTGGSSCVYYATIDPARLEELRAVTGVHSVDEECASGGACGGAC
jgi:hypothetical protein